STDHLSTMTLAGASVRTLLACTSAAAAVTGPGQPVAENHSPPRPNVRQFSFLLKYSLDAARALSSTGVNCPDESRITRSVSSGDSMWATRLMDASGSLLFLKTPKLIAMAHIRRPSGPPGWGSAR